MTRIQSRTSAGRYRQSSLSDMGLGTRVCPFCAAFNPFKVGIEPAPTICDSCCQRLCDELPDDPPKKSDPADRSVQT